MVGDLVFKDGTKIDSAKVSKEREPMSEKPPQPKAEMPDDAFHSDLSP